MTVRTSPGAPSNQNGTGNRNWLSRPWLWLPAVLGAVLVALFFQSFQPGQILFANDVTLGQMKAPPNQLPGAFAGSWHSGVWLGIEGVAVAPTISAFLTFLLSPEIFLKIYAPLSLLFVGLCAWVFFRQLKFNPWVCLLGGLAAGLNMHFFSVACWGLGAWNIATGMIFLALAALSTKSIPQLWARGILAGLAVGMNLMEGFDIGAIQCVFVGLFIVWQIFTNETPGSKKVITAFCTEALVIFFSAFIAVHSISSLVTTQVEGVVGTGQDVQTKEDHWDFATRWSLPKVESLRVMVPGLFGYRMGSRITVSDKSSAYWGTVGRDTRIIDVESGTPDRRAKAFDALALSPEKRSDLSNSDRQVRDNAFRALLAKYSSAGRYSGSGEFAGVLVSILALFALVNSWRGAAAPYSFGERRAVWFWGGTALISLLASWGRYGFFYRLLYHLPYFSTIRNPIKFMHPFHVAWVILAAYGLEALSRRYMQAARPPSETSKNSGFEKKWIIATLALLAASVVAVVIFDSRKPRLIEYLVQEAFATPRAIAMADFANTEARWFVFWLLVSVGVIAAALKRVWTGPNARTAWIIFGIIIIVDLVRSDLPWIHYFDYKTEYAAPSTFDILEDKPYEHRVIGRIVPKGVGSGIATRLGQLYDYWQQNDFPYHGIQALDFPQWPRTPELDASYIKNFGLSGGNLREADLWPAERLWELTSTRYIFFAADLEPILNAKADAHHGLRVNTYLTVRAKPGVTYVEDAGDMTAVPEYRGEFALFEFTNALPRAGLYANWQSSANDAATLQTLLSHDFDPHHTVLISQNTPLAQSPADPKADPGTVSIAVFKPKYVKLQASAATPAILLLNDRIHPDWRAWIDGKPAPVLRCNYLMRGVFLTPGEHTVEFHYKPSLTTFWLSLCAWGVGILTAGYLIWSRKPAPKPPVSVPPPSPPPSAEAVPIKQKSKDRPAPVTAEAPSRQRRDGKRTRRP